MNVTYEHKSTMTFIGFSTSIRPEEGYIKCPEFWDKEYAQKYARLWQTMKPETPVEAAILENSVGLFAICDEGWNSQANRTPTVVLFRRRRWNHLRRRIFFAAEADCFHWQYYGADGCNMFRSRERSDTAPLTASCVSRANDK